MIAERNIESLLSQWRERLFHTDNSEEYKIAVRECIYELQNTLDTIKNEEEANLQEVLANLPSPEVEDYLRGLEADDYLASLEAHTA